MATLPREDYLKIHYTAAGLAKNGLTIFRWEPSERYPRYEWANEVVVTRSMMDRAELLGENSTFSLSETMRVWPTSRANASTTTMRRHSKSN